MTLVVYIISFIIANMIVVRCREMIMKFMGASSMRFSMNTHLGITFFIAVIMGTMILGFINNLIG